MIYSKVIKPVMDRLIALIAIVVLLPLWVLIYFFIKISQGGSVIFVQKRSGKNLEPFVIYKIKTLKPDMKDGLSLSDRKYTRFGRQMRLLGIDELPQLFNILKGEMSFIGPRALPVEYAGLFQKEQLKRFTCKPGITGWAQVHGRNDICWEKRLRLDAWYADHISFWVDIKIAWKTIIYLGSKQEKETIMPIFTGSSL